MTAWALSLLRCTVDKNVFEACETKTMGAWDEDFGDMKLQIKGFRTIRTFKKICVHRLYCGSGQRPLETCPYFSAEICFLKKF